LFVSVLNIFVLVGEGSTLKKKVRERKVSLLDHEELLLNIEKKAWDFKLSFMESIISVYTIHNGGDL